MKCHVTFQLKFCLITLCNKKKIFFYVAQGFLAGLNYNLGAEFKYVLSFSISHQVFEVQ